MQDVCTRDLRGSVLLDNSEYEDFLGCLSDSNEEGAEISETKRTLDNCFSSSYNEEEEENSIQPDSPARTDESENALHALATPENT